MKVIDVPEPVKYKLVLRNPNNELEEVERTLTFPEFLTGAFEGYEKFAKGPAMARQFNKLMDVVESIEGKSLAFEDADFLVVKAAVDSATWVHAKINRAAIPFYAAVDKAEDVKTPTESKK